MESNFLPKRCSCFLGVSLLLSPRFPFDTPPPLFPSLAHEQRKDSYFEGLHLRKKRRKDAIFDSLFLGNICFVLPLFSLMLLQVRFSSPLSACSIERSSLLGVSFFLFFFRESIVCVSAPRK